MKKITLKNFDIEQVSDYHIDILLQISELSERSKYFSPLYFIQYNYSYSLNEIKLAFCHLKNIGLLECFSEDAIRIRDKIYLEKDIFEKIDQMQAVYAAMSEFVSFLPNLLDDNQKRSKTMAILNSYGQQFTTLTRKLNTAFVDHGILSS